MNVRILREAGGLGDVICTLPVARAVKEKSPEAKVYYFCLEDYRDVIEHCPDVDMFVPVDMEGRRPRDQEPDAKTHAYLATENLSEDVRKALGDGGFDRTIDLWCPAFRYEKEQGHNVARSRIESFCESAGLTPSDYLPRYVVTEKERAWARGWIEAQGFERRSVVGLQPFSLNNRRDWPVQNWIDLADILQKQGAAVLVFHSFFSKVKDIPGRKVTSLPLAQVAAILTECDCVVTPDSGLFHLSAAVGAPAVGLFGSTSAVQTAKHYPQHKVIWPKDAPREHKCNAPCMSFQWCGCEQKCHENGCEILAKIKVQEVLDMIAPMRQKAGAEREQKLQLTRKPRRKLVTAAEKVEVK